MIKQRATNQIADVCRALLQRRTFTSWDLQLTSDQRLSVRNRIDAGKLQNYKLFVRPRVFDLQLATAAIFRQRQQPQSLMQSVWNVAVQLDGNFSVPPLCFRHTGQSDEFPVGRTFLSDRLLAFPWNGYSRISNS